MKKPIIVLLAIIFLTGCVTTQPQAGADSLTASATTTLDANNKLVTPIPKLTGAEIAAILNTAIMDIESQNCQAQFLIEEGDFIWVRCFDEQNKPTMKIYGLKELLEGYLKQKAEKEKNVKSP